MKSIISNFIAVFILLFMWSSESNSQGLVIPNNNVNFKCGISRTIHATDIHLKWNSPGVKGREGKVFGTDIAPFGLNVLGFGSNVHSPWRAGADECTNISFSTDVQINGSFLPAGNYAFFIILQPDTCTLIFNKNVTEWGSYFYDSSLDVLRVKTIPIKNRPNITERLQYNFIDQTDHAVTIVLDWESWRIPFQITLDPISTVYTSIKSQMTTGLGFDPPSLIQAARWLLNNDVELEQANEWIIRATDPNLGGVASFQALSTKARILEKQDKLDEAEKIMNEAYKVGTLIELHQFGRQMLNLKKVDEAMKAFENNFVKYHGEWPSNVGMMRGYSAIGNIQKALQHAKLALPQAPDEVNRINLENCIKTLESGKKI